MTGALLPEKAAFVLIPSVDEWLNGNSQITASLFVVFKKQKLKNFLKALAKWHKHREGRGMFLVILDITVIVQ